MSVFSISGRQGISGTTLNLNVCSHCWRQHKKRLWNSRSKHCFCLFPPVFQCQLFTCIVLCGSIHSSCPACISLASSCYMLLRPWYPGWVSRNQLLSRVYIRPSSTAGWACLMTVESVLVDYPYILIKGMGTLFTCMQFLLFLIGISKSVLYLVDHFQSCDLWACLHVLPLLVWVFPGHSGLFPQSMNILHRLIYYPKSGMSKVRPVFTFPPACRLLSLYQ